MSSRSAVGHGDFKGICDLSSLSSIENTKGIKCCYNFLAMIDHIADFLLVLLGKQVIMSK